MLTGPVVISRDAVLAHDTFLFDADGVLWTGDTPVPGAVEFVSGLLAAGKRVFILTNNSTKTLDQYMAKILRMGYGAVPRDHVISPAIVLAAYMKDRPDYKDQTVYLIGTDSLKHTLETDGGVSCFGTGPDPITAYTKDDILHDVDLSATPKAVVCSFDSHFSYPKLMKAANYLSRPDVEFLITNEDYTFPGPNPSVIIPGSGSWGACLRAVSDREAIVFGKPHSQMADYLKRRHHIDPTSTIMFGDRLDTDMAFANANSIASCLVLTGVHSLEDVAKAASKGSKHVLPKYTFSFA